MTGPAGTTGTPWDRPGPEVPLPGGVANRGRVVRVGDTVRRPLRRTSPATHALLDHLAAVGFDGAPRVLGTDRQGREVLGYIPGTAVTPPYPDWALTDAALRSVARLLADYHRAVAGFDPTPHSWPQPPPDPYAGELVGHNDLNLDNVVFRGGRAVALIDFDLAGPGSRLWDVACAARQWAPVRPDATVRDARQGQGLRRLRVFADAYGLTGAERAALPAAIQQNQEWFGGVVERYAAAGHAGFLEYWRSGTRLGSEEYRAWLAGQEPALRAALSG
ncbi:Ser/Thr protein kinase RdoA involved in Cpx stress response, MazF antagonist [Geodermatophilus pulveris]|uniref:Ser/Thr protein kinase RdoA involved in Cpx stress response, MazF antagonist n=1 Tax=Geodermatophilus pulveris TaxID=1564159 RepID=A0A239GZ18_9ACTN|nr:phosphotransferase [Geodermatophilus pulveris]SNS74105.1 Ser/Thr protein kinase RdoA involved in Cpx stress response, MazF antagonist [Geodermatophilus pulveris]